MAEPADFFTAHKFKETINVTCFYFGLYYAFLFIQVIAGVLIFFCTTKSLTSIYLFNYQSIGKWYVYFHCNETKEGKRASFTDVKYRSNNKLSLTLDRTSGNLIEQAIPFLTSLWLCAVFTNPQEAATIGWYYVLFRALYPAGFYYGLPYILFSTAPGYVCIFLLLWKCYMAANTWIFKVWRTNPQNFCSIFHIWSNWKGLNCILTVPIGSIKTQFFIFRASNSIKQLDAVMYVRI